MLTVGSIMSRAPLTAPADGSLERALELMHARKLRHLPVVEHERLVGLLSERDLIDRPLPTDPEQASAAQVHEHMSAYVESVGSEDSVLSACGRLLERRVGCMPVVDDGRLLGMLGETELLRLYARVCRSTGDDASLDPRLEDCMTREVHTIDPRASVEEAFELCRAKGIRHLPVLDEGWLVGIVSERNLLPVIGRGAGAGRTVADIMTRDTVAVTGLDTHLSEAVDCMLRDDFHALPVVADGALKGIVTSVDALLTLSRIDELVLAAAWRSEPIRDSEHGQP